VDGHIEEFLDGAGVAGVVFMVMRHHDPVDAGGFRLRLHEGPNVRPLIGRPRVDQGSADAIANGLRVESAAVPARPASCDGPVLDPLTSHAASICVWFWAKGRGGQSVPVAG
jgi:hypothetical protein